MPIFVKASSLLWSSAFRRIVWRVVDFLWRRPWRPAWGHGDFQEAPRFDEVFSEGAVYTTEEVLTELPAFFAPDRWLRNRAVETVRAIRSDSAVRIIPRSHESFTSRFDLYAARPDKGYSLTDCISMQAIRREGLTDVLTNNHHFCLQLTINSVIRRLRPCE